MFTDYDTKLEIFTADGNCAATTTGNYVDDATCTISSVNPPSYAASLSNVTLGAGTYYIVVDGFSGQTGNYQVDVTVSTGRERNPGSGQFDLAYELEKLRAGGLADWEIEAILGVTITDPIIFSRTGGTNTPKITMETGVADSAAYLSLIHI